MCKIALLCYWEPAILCTKLKYEKYSTKMKLSIKIDDPHILRCLFESYIRYLLDVSKIILFEQRGNLSDIFFP